jgi:fatty-acyl-CoA synthase
MPDISLGSWFARRAIRSASRRALTFEGTTWTYGELLDRIDRLAAALRAGGVCHGDRVAFIGFNQPAFVETMFATARLGAIFVPLNFRLTGQELTYIIGDAGVHTLVAGPEHRELIEPVRTALPVRRYLAVEPAEGWEPYGAVRDAAEPLGRPATVGEDEVALIMYTSGTTGLPKGATLTHGNLWWNNANYMHLLDFLEDDVTLVCAPLFHIGGLNLTTLVTWQKGGEVVLHRSFDAAAVLAAIPAQRITSMFGVPAQFLFLSQQPEFEVTDLTSIRLLITGGAPMPEHLLRLYLERGVPIQQGYGLTEAAPNGSMLTSEWGLAKLGSSGMPPLFTDLRIVDDENRPITETDVRGELCLRGPNVMKGYWNQPEATAAAIDGEGWLHTGDVAYFDADGFLYVADRLKDMVITGGENVYPAEVENVLYEHPAIAEVAVIGLPDDQWGEAVTAVAVVQEGATLELEELREFGRASLAGYKLPRRLHLVDVLPRNPSGKVLKFELRDQLG